VAKKNRPGEEKKEGEVEGRTKEKKNNLSKPRPMTEKGVTLNCVPSMISEGEAG